MLIIPMTNDASQRFTVLAGGQETVITLSWNDDAGAWIADISLSDGTALVRGRRVCAGVPVLKQFGIRLVQEFDGDFVAFPRSQPVTEPGRLARGATHDFLYVEKGEAVNAATFAGAGELGMAKRTSFTRPRFDLELAVSDSWPPLWSLTSKNGEKHYFPLAVTGWTQDGFHSASLMLGPFCLSLTVFTGEW